MISKISRKRPVYLDTGFLTKLRTWCGSSVHHWCSRLLFPSTTTVHSRPRVRNMVKGPEAALWLLSMGTGIATHLPISAERRRRRTLIPLLFNGQVFRLLHISPAVDSRVRSEAFTGVNTSTVCKSGGMRLFSVSIDAASAFFPLTWQTPLAAFSVGDLARLCEYLMYPHQFHRPSSSIVIVSYLHKHSGCANVVPFTC